MAAGPKPNISCIGDSTISSLCGCCRCKHVVLLQWKLHQLLLLHADKLAAITSPWLLGARVFFLIFKANPDKMLVEAVGVNLDERR